MHKFVFVLLLLPLFCFSEEVRLHGLILLDPSEKVVTKNLQSVEGVQVNQLDVPGGAEKLSEELLPVFLDCSPDEPTINLLKRKIAAYYQRNNHPVVKVIVPEQDFSKGTLQLIVLESRLGHVCVKGNQYTCDEAISKWMRLEPCDRINEQTLIQDLSWINTNPFRRVNAVFRPGETYGTTDIDLMVWDRKMWRAYIGADNTGTPVIGRTRWFTGINLNNIFLPDHTLSFQFTTANKFSEFKSYTFNYAAPLPWRHTASFFGAYARVRPNRPPFQSDGRTYQCSGRYTIPYWFNRTALIDQITGEIGFDWKGTNNNIIFGSEDEFIPVSAQLVWIGQFTGSLTANYTRRGTTVSGGIDAFWSPGRMLDHQTDADFASLRPGATAKYFYTRMNLSYNQIVYRDWNVFALGRLQLANSNLLGSEQFALGGFSTVRGYDERVVNGDNAVCGNFELRTPSWGVISYWKRRVKDSMHALAFLDVGYAWDHQEIPGLPLAQTLLGMGPGLRYQISPYFLSRLDLGFPFYSVVGDSGNPRIHFSILLSY